MAETKVAEFPGSSCPLPPAMPGRVGGPAVAWACVIQTFVFTLAHIPAPLYAICGAAGARTPRRVNEARNLGPSLVANKMNMPSGL